ncbi:hypothetical protein VE03_04734 [Pseudogymnoascus sp. 23342-1-I1]|nr:hypothetical protein VE03_04734 [Pseudogymnoascus sp. 23342-1-I1]
MDPLSLTASIIGVLQATATIVSYVNDARDAPSDQARFAKETQSLSDLLTNLICRLNGGKDKSEAWYAEVESLGKPDGPLAQDQGRGGAGEDRKYAVVEVIKEEVASILFQIERMKSLIQIALQMDHL